MKRRIFLAGALTMCALMQAQAHDYKIGAIQIDHPYSRPVPNIRTPGIAYMTIANKGETSDRLVGASSPAVGKIELHANLRDGDVMRMRPVDAIDLAAAGVLRLQPGGRWHLMLIDLAKPLQVGDKFPLTLKFRDAGEVQVEIEVQRASGPQSHQH
jgi:periplasmic copper chaperone A